MARLDGRLGASSRTSATTIPTGSRSGARSPRIALQVGDYERATEMADLVLGARRTPRPARARRQRPPSRSGTAAFYQRPAVAGSRPPRGGAQDRRGRDTTSTTLFRALVMLPSISALDDPREALANERDGIALARRVGNRTSETHHHLQRGRGRAPDRRLGLGGRGDGRRRPARHRRVRACVGNRAQQAFYEVYRGTFDRGRAARRCSAGSRCSRTATSTPGCSRSRARSRMPTATGPRRRGLDRRCADVATSTRRTACRGPVARRSSPATRPPPRRPLDRARRARAPRVGRWTRTAPRSGRAWPRSPATRTGRASGLPRRRSRAYRDLGLRVGRGAGRHGGRQLAGRRRRRARGLDRRLARERSPASARRPCWPASTRASSRATPRTRPARRPRPGGRPTEAESPGDAPSRSARAEAHGRAWRPPGARPGRGLDRARVPDVVDTEDHVLAAGVGELAEPVDDLLRALAVAAVDRDPDRLERRALDLVGVAPDRLAVARAGPRTCGGSSPGPPNTLVASAYCATRRSVFCSPPPPIMIGGRGRLIACGRVQQPASRATWRPSKAASVPRSPCHMSWAYAQGVLEHLEPLAEGREREARGPSTPPGSRRRRCPASARPPDSTSSVVAALTHSAGLAVVDAADHEAEARPARVRGHEPERRPALEHRLLGAAPRSGSGRSGP